jgi:hypothetical protein
MLGLVCFSGSLVRPHDDFKCFPPLFGLEIVSKYSFLNERAFWLEFIGFKYCVLTDKIVFREHMEMNPEVC